jgi:hypothetical protein
LAAALGVQVSVAMTNDREPTDFATYCGKRWLFAAAALVVVWAFAGGNAQGGVIVAASSEAATSPLFDCPTPAPAASDGAVHEADDQRPVGCFRDQETPKSRTGNSSNARSGRSTLAIATNIAILPDRMQVARQIFDCPPAIELPPVFDRLHPPRRA